MSTAERSLGTEAPNTDSSPALLATPQGEATPTSAHVPSLRATLALCIGTFTLLPAVYAPQPVLPLLSQDFHISPGVAGLTLSVFNIALALSLLVAGPLSDRIGRRPLIITASLLLVIPTLLAAAAPSYGLLLVARAAQGVLASGIGAVAIAYIGDELPPAQRGNALGWYSMAMSWSALLGRVGGGLLAGQFGWRGMFIGLGALSLLGALTLTLGLPPARRFTPSADAWAAFRQMGDTLRSRVLISGYLVGFLMGVILLGFLTYISYYLSAPPFNLSTSQLGLIFLAYVFGLAAPLAGSISTRVGRRPVITVCLLILSTGIVLTRIEVLAVVLLGVILLALGLISAFSMTNAYVGDHAADRRGGATGLYLFGWYTGGAVGAAALGPLWTATGWSGVTLACLGMMLAALVALWALRSGKTKTAHS
jgi:YNFM family putative membrane transporter